MNLIKTTDFSKTVLGQEYPFKGGEDYEIVQYEGYFVMRNKANGKSWAENISADECIRISYTIFQKYKRAYGLKSMREMDGLESFLRAKKVELTGLGKTINADHLMQIASKYFKENFQISESL